MLHFNFLETLDDIFQSTLITLCLSSMAGDYNVAVSSHNCMVLLCQLESFKKILEQLPNDLHFQFTYQCFKIYL